MPIVGPVLNGRRRVNGVSQPFQIQPSSTSKQPRKIEVGELSCFDTHYGELSPEEISKLKLLVRMPTRSRPKQALDVLTKYREMAGLPITIEVIIDDNDALMHTSEVTEQLLKLDCVITSKSHNSKIEAVNDGRVSDWDILLSASDDMVPVKEGYAKKIINSMARYFPHMDGALYFDDNYAGRKLCTLSVIGRRLYDQFGYVYYPEYKSFFCDNEQTEVLQAVKRLLYIDEKLIEHRHFANDKAPVPVDSLYTANSVFWNHDQMLYNRRCCVQRPFAQAAFDSPPVWLSLLIATVPSRQSMLNKLISFLYEQMHQYPREVEIITDARECVTIGAKRNDMLTQSVGRFVAHIDDDDWVSDDYVKRVLEALKSTPDADCASLCGIRTVDGKGEEFFKDSICYKEWGGSAETGWERTPEHRNAVRRDLALKVGFPDVSFGEDHEFSDRLRPLLSKEVSTGDKPIYFYQYDSTKPPDWYYKHG